MKGNRGLVIIFISRHQISTAGQMEEREGGP